MLTFSKLHTCLATYMLLYTDPLMLKPSHTCTRSHAHTCSYTPKHILALAHTLPSSYTHCTLQHVHSHMLTNVHTLLHMHIHTFTCKNMCSCKNNHILKPSHVHTLLHIHSCSHALLPHSHLTSLCVPAYSVITHSHRLSYECTYILLHTHTFIPAQSHIFMH